MPDLRITLVQSKLFWEDPEKNLDHFTELLSQVPRGSTDLVVLPEMFTTGFTMNAKGMAESFPGLASVAMQVLARDLRAVICGSIVAREGSLYYNRLLWVPPSGTILHYDKRHLFRMAKEHQTYTAGTERLEVKLKGWNICPLVCYDLRFPVWSRSNGKTDLLLYVANWPARRRFAWNQLLIARAIENQCYVTGVNRVGKDGNNIAYAGESAVLDFMGTRISRMRANSQGVETITLSKPALTRYRKVFPVFRDADQFRIL